MCIDRIKRVAPATPGVLQLGGIEPLAEAVVDRGEQLGGLPALALLAPQPGTLQSLQLGGAVVLPAGGGF